MRLRVVAAQPLRYGHAARGVASVPGHRSAGERKTAMRIGKAIGWAAAAIAGSIAGAAQAAQPVPWEMGFQPAATPVMEQIEDFHNLLLIITTLVTLVVLVLLLYAVWKFSAKRNPIPTKTTHNTLLEMAWTVVPVIILVVIAVRRSNSSITRTSSRRRI